MQSSGLQEIIKKITLYKKKLITIEELVLLTAEIFVDDIAHKKLYKAMYYLKQRGYLLSLKKDMFLIKRPDETNNEQYYIDQYYRPLLAQHCKERYKEKRYIGGETALAFHIQQYHQPETIQIINLQKQGYEILLTGRKIQRKTYTHTKINITTKILPLTITSQFLGPKLRYANLNLALLETLYNNNPSHPLILDMVKKALKKTKEFVLDDFHTLLKLGKHHTSINHLYTIAKIHHPKFALQLAEVIKKSSFFM